MRRTRLPLLSLVFALAAFWAAAAAHAALPIQHWQTGNGARVYFVETRALPILDLSVTFPAGSAYDAPGKAGLANLTRHLLSLGAAGLSEEAIATGLADVGAELGGSFDRDRAGLSLRTLSGLDARGPALDLFTKVLQRPDFPEAVLGREKARVVSAIKEGEAKPEVIADKAFYARLYPDHPYGRPEVGTVETVPTLRRADLEAFYQSHYRANRAVIAMIGDLSPEEARALAERLSGGLPAGATPAPAELPEVAALADAASERLAHPASQSHILMGVPGVARGDPDYYALYVGNYVLGGGGFDSRLMDEVREKRGYAYSAYSYFLPLAEPGPFQIGLQTKKQLTDEALKVVHDTLTAFIRSGPTTAELAQAKNNIVGGFPLRIDSNAKILDYLAVIGFYRLPLTYLEDFPREVAAVTAAQVRAAFARHVQPGRMVTVVVGPEAPGGPVAAADDGAKPAADDGGGANAAAP